MPETPDLELIAEQLVHEAAMVIGATRAETDCVAARHIIEEQLRQVWNARGAADRSAIAKHFMGSVSEHVERTLKALDR